MISKNAFVLLLGSSTGCATSGSVGEPTPASAQEPAAPPASAEAASKVDENLNKLRALSVFEVGSLVVDAPEGAYSCYGVCPQFKEAVAAAEQRSAGRLERLVAVATAATPDASAATCEPAAIDRNLAALRGLEIVQIPGLVAEQPKNSPQCYNNPCPDDIAAAQAKTCERAAKLAGIAAAAKGL